MRTQVPWREGPKAVRIPVPAAQSLRNSRRFLFISSPLIILIPGFHTSVAGNDFPYAIWVQGNDSHQAPVRPREATARSLSVPWRFVGSGFPTLNMSDGKENGLTHGNFEFIRFDGALHVFSLDYPHGHEYLYTLLDSARPLN
jgi:hypothetical protein